METTYNVETADLDRQVQALLCLKAFDDICADMKGRIMIVPLKGIDLMRCLYSDTLDRELKDIDLLIVPPEQAKDLIDKLLRDGYRAEFSYGLDNTVLNSKKKVSLLSPTEHLPDIDVHLALITKQFFSTTINGFNQDAILRLKKQDDTVAVLDDTDRWLYLAVHLAFHFLDGDKWYRDLALLLERFGDGELSLVVSRAKKYNLERVVGAVCTRMKHHYPQISSRINVKQLLPDNSGRRFLRYIEVAAANPHILGHGFRLARYYWEFIFIGCKRQRYRSLMSLMLPSVGGMCNIYRCNAFPAVLLYLPHLLINIIGISLFAIQYIIKSSDYDKTDSE